MAWRDEADKSGWQCVVFCLEGQRYALHLSQVERVLSMVAVSPLPETPAVVAGVINYRGSVVPVLDLRPRFGFARREFGLTDQLLLARTTRRMLALPVDEVLGVNEVPASCGFGRRAESPSPRTNGVARSSACQQRPSALERRPQCSLRRTSRRSIHSPVSGTPRPPAGSRQK